MVNLIRTNSDNTDFRELVALLDAELQIRDGAEHGFYAQFNKIDKIREVVVAYENEIAVGCGAFKEYLPRVAEIKRMFVLPERRGNGIAGSVLNELEAWASELNFSECILDRFKTTRSRQALSKKRIRYYSELWAIRGRRK
jgi:putative acetyltransferase